MTWPTDIRGQTASAEPSGLSVVWFYSHPPSTVGNKDATIASYALSYEAQ
jgi:hypothetical protein